MNKLLLLSMALSGGSPQVVVPASLMPASISPSPLPMATMTPMPSSTMGKASRPLVSAPALTLQLAAKDIAASLIGAAQGQDNGGQMFDASVNREAGSLDVAANQDEALRAKVEAKPDAKGKSPDVESSNWKYLSKDSVEVLRAVAAGGEMDGYKLMSRTGLDAGQLGRTLREISSYPLIHLASVLGYTSAADVGNARVSLLPSAAGTIDLFLNDTWSKLTHSSLTVLRALKPDGATSGDAIMRATGFDQTKLSAVLAEISGGRFPLVTMTGNASGPSTIAPLPSTARFIEALLAYRK